MAVEHDPGSFQFFDTIYKKPLLVPLLIAASSVAVLLTNIWGLRLGITYVLPHLFYVPVILASYYYPRRGVLVATVLSACYCAAAFTITPPSATEMISAIARSVVFIVIAAVVSTLSGRMHHDTQMCRRLVSAVRSSGEAIIGETLDGTVTDWNAGAEQLYGYTAAEMVGQSVFRLIPPERREAKRALLLKIRQGISTERLETERITKDGRRITVSISSSPILNSVGEIVGASQITHDITERKRAEAALALAGRKMNLLSGITRHDILNQLTALKAYIELSRETADPAALAGIIAKEETIASTLERQITFTRVYQDLGMTAPVWQNVRMIVAQSAAALPLRNVAVTDDAAGVEVFADLLFEKVFYNLIDNALKYGGDALSEIRVTSRVEGGTLTIVCEDNGAGISAADKKHLFAKGFGKHTGLGLFLPREILAITGISIAETSRPGAGARFEITVPEGAWRFAEPGGKTA